LVICFGLVVDYEAGQDLVVVFPLGFYETSEKDVLCHKYKNMKRNWNWMTKKRV